MSIEPIRFRLTTEHPARESADAVVVGVFDDGTLSTAAAEIDAASGGTLRKLLGSGDISGRSGRHAWLPGLAGVAAPRLLAVGLGDARKFDRGKFVRACREAARALRGGPSRTVACYLAEVDVEGTDAAWRLRQAALAFDFEHYRFDAMRKPPEHDTLLEAAAFRASVDAIELSRAQAIARGVRLARELGNLPPNVCTPSYLVEQARALSTDRAGVEFESVDAAGMRELGMHSLLAVGGGSVHPPQLILLRWRGAADPDAPPIALVGKGITFDTGGANIKPTAGMEEMKYDMCGGAGVLGTFAACVALELPINLVCVVPAAENMPDGAGYRPSDVLRTLSGKTVEVLNTDAEGRLILCDALTYVVQRYKPSTVIDVATLTGACMVALGTHASGLMTHDDSLADELLDAGQDSWDRAWRLPLWDDYQSQLESGSADFANIGSRWGGAITAGCFLSRFVEKQRWAHLDIAGSASTEGRKGSATGRPVGLLTEWLIRQAG